MRSREIGWDNETITLWLISKQLDRLIKIAG